MRQTTAPDTSNHGVSRRNRRHPDLPAHDTMLTFLGLFRNTQARPAIEGLNSKATPTPPFILAFPAGIYHLG